MHLPLPSRGQAASGSMLDMHLFSTLRRLAFAPASMSETKNGVALAPIESSRGRRPSHSDWETARRHRRAPSLRLAATGSCHRRLRSLKYGGRGGFGA